MLNLQEPIVRVHHPVAIGDEAPDFTLLNQDQMLITLSSFKGKCGVVLFFYPMDYSPICTLEVIAFREAYEVFVKRGVEVIGVSDSPPQSHASFCKHLQLPFDLLTDDKHRVRNAFGVTTILGHIAPRVTFVIDHMGVVRNIFVATLLAKAHVAAAIETLDLFGTQAAILPQLS